MATARPFSVNYSTNAVNFVSTVDAGLCKICLFLLQVYCFAWRQPWKERQ